MALHGKIIEVSREKYAFEYITTVQDKPEQIRQVWPISSLHTRGSMSYCRNDEAIGKAASLTDGRITCYLGNGNYVHGELPDLGSTKSTTIEISPVPRPKCRSELRWRNGQWQKLTAKGWKYV